MARTIMGNKRRADFAEPASKKPRTENGNQFKDQSSPRNINSLDQSSLRKSSKPVPELPSINSELSKAVFTHQSLAPQANDAGGEVTYERLEFLGDAYIEGMATRLIWGQFKDMSPGRMSQVRELLVKNETLYEFASLHQFQDRIRTVPAVKKDPKLWLKVVADVFEAYVAAIILSEPVNGFKIAEEWLVQLWESKLKDIPRTGPNLKAKEELFKLAGGKGIQIKYRDEAPMEQLKGGMQTYFIGVYLTGWGYQDEHLGSGKGLNKVSAGNEAASKALQDKPKMAEIRAKKDVILAPQRAREEEEKRLDLKIYD